MTLEPDACNEPAALALATEVVSRALIGPVPALPTWGPCHWQMARVAALLHGIGPLLAAAGVWPERTEWREFVEEQRRAVALKQQRIDDLLRRLGSDATRLGLPVVALKGSALHLMGVVTAGYRPMGDIDLLVRGQDLAAIEHVILAMDYRLLVRAPRHDVYAPPASELPEAFGEQADSPVKIEVHTRIAERLPRRVVDITHMLTGDWRVGLHPYPDSASAMMHQVLHAAANMSVRWLRHLQLHDIALLARRLAPADWQAFGAMLADSAGGTVGWAYPPLLLSQRYLAAPIPSDLLAQVRERCPRLLRHETERSDLTRFSGSAYWLDPLPAWRWAGGPLELLDYLRSRLWPEAREREASEAFFRQQSWAGMGHWYDVGRWRRVVRWLVDRPARPQILDAIRLAGMQSRPPEPH